MKIKMLSERAIMPTRGSEDSAGYDLYAACTNVVTIPAGESRKIPTDIALEIPKGFFGGIYARSGLATNQGLRPVNCTGVIDADYRGNIIVALHNDSSKFRSVEPGERIAQIIIMPYLKCALKLVDDLDETERGEDGFGSTGTR